MIDLVDGVGSLHLDIHGYEEGEEEENPAGESQQLTGGELGVRSNLWRRTSSLVWIILGKNPDQYCYRNELYFSR